MNTVLILICLPIFTSILIAIISSQRMHYLLAIAAFSILSAASLLFYASQEIITVHLPSSIHLSVVAIDVLLLLFFLYQGVKFKSPKVLYLSVVQLVLFVWAESAVPIGESADVVVDQLSKFMFLIINIVGSVIVLYAIRYMEDERTTPFKKRVFVAGLLLFLSVMNVIVCANSILLFFLLFELTTLASYLLIAFRNDEVSRHNALRALWMNQIGGVVILLGVLVAIHYFGTVMFDILLQDSGGLLLLSVALISMAALVKGASIPFDGWLLGAMVAPTPVSAMLHSAAMVKIAPYLVLKLSPVLGNTPVGEVFAIVGALVFVGASYLALARSVLKEILGYSTVALLGLMMSLAAIGTQVSIHLAMALLAFHALSKALLFLAAGVLEKQHHVKNIEEMEGMSHRAPSTVGYILFGFVSLTLPPFGLLMGKLFAIVSVASLLDERPWLLMVLVAMLVGSSLLVLLYFKVASALLSKPSDMTPALEEELPYGYGIPMMILTLLIGVATVVFIWIQQNFLLSLLAFPLLLVIFIPYLVKRLDRYDRSSPYHCGEKESFDGAVIYFNPSNRLRNAIYWGFTFLFLAVAIAGVLS